MTDTRLSLVIAMTSNQLIPNATSPQLKTQLETTRTMVQTHLTSAKEIQQTLASQP